MTRLVLASASAGRLSVLRQAGVEPQVVVSGVDEDAVIAALPGAPPADVVAALATAKARDVASGITSDCVVIGCDSMLLLDGQLRGKPGTVDAARSQWRSMAGRSGQLLTGHCVIRIDGGKRGEFTESSSTTVHFGTPSDEDLDAYVAGGEPLWVAGAFTLDGLGGWFIDGIDGAPSNVIGLNLPLLRRMLTRVDISVARLWASNPPPPR